jgi:hypothetical protein
MGKFAYVKSLHVEDFDFTGIGRNAFVAMWDRLINLEVLYNCQGEQDSTVPALVWFLLLMKPSMVLRVLDFHGWNLHFVRPEMSFGLDLPVTLNTVRMDLRPSAAAEYRNLFEVLDRLPNLDRLELLFKTTNREIFAFPKLLRCLKSAFIIWPDHADIMRTDIGIEDLWIESGDPVEQGALCHGLRRLTNLKTLYVNRSNVSPIAIFSSAPTITNLTVNVSFWNLDGAARAKIAGPVGRRLTLDARYPKPSKQEQEEAVFWKPLPWVTYNDE